MSLFIKTLIFTVVVPATVTIYLPHALLGASREPQTGSLHYLGLLPIISGAAIYCWCAWDFATAGRGTPAPVAPPKKLVARGLYRHMRNPMYVGVTAILLGESLFFHSLTLFWYALAVVLMFHVWVIIYEEPTLRGKFGDSYERYCQSVSRWLPRLRATDARR